MQITEHGAQMRAPQCLYAARPGQLLRCTAATATVGT
jgi:hypothetical protein